MKSRLFVVIVALTVGGCLLYLPSISVERPSAIALTSETSELESILTTVAPNKDVLVTLSDVEYYTNGVLPLWLEGVLKSNISHFLVVATDTDLVKILQDLQIPVYLYLNRPAAQNATGRNHAISAIKYGFLEEILSLGWNVLLSDADVVTLQNPFEHLHRDVDVEAMSDGTDEASAYGSIVYFDDPTMGWSRYSQGIEHSNLNSGLFYVRSTIASRDLMMRLIDRLERETYWDQQAFNEEMFFLRHGDVDRAGVSVRVMDIYTFMNSKTLFKRVRYNEEMYNRMPVMVHINYHPDKQARMRAVMQFYEGDTTALDAFDVV